MIKLVTFIGEPVHHVSDLRLRSNKTQRSVEAILTWLTLAPVKKKLAFSFLLANDTKRLLRHMEREAAFFSSLLISTQIYSSREQRGSGCIKKISISFLNLTSVC